jgi:hypothetical protein
MSEVFLSSDRLSHGFFERYAKRGVAVYDGDADLSLCDLSVKVPRNEALWQLPMRCGRSE